MSGDRIDGPDESLGENSIEGCKGHNEGVSADYVTAITIMLCITVINEGDMLFVQRHGVILIVLTGQGFS